MIITLGKLGDLLLDLHEYTECNISQTNYFYKILLEKINYLTKLFSNNILNMTPHPKGTTISDPIVLERLAKARAKALESRKAKAQAKKDEKLVSQIEEKKKRQATQDKLKELIDKPKEEPEPPKEEPDAPKEDPPKYEEVVEETPPPNLKKSPTKQDLKEEDEPEIEYMKIPKKKPKKKKVVYVEESSSDDEEIEYVKKPKVKKDKPKQPSSPTDKFDYPRNPQETILDQLYNKYYGR